VKTRAADERLAARLRVHQRLISFPPAFPLINNAGNKPKIRAAMIDLATNSRLTWREAMNADIGADDTVFVVTTRSSV